jgi:6-phosphogluconolactonase (cycloisomerase 2 family)
MKKLRKHNLSRAAAIAAWLLILSASALAATSYIVANDDTGFPFITGVSFYTIDPGGILTLKGQVQTGGYGIGGGYFGANRLAVLNSGQQECIFASEALTGDIAGIRVHTLSLGGRASGSATDAGTSNGIGLVASSRYLYASFTDSNTIGTFKVEPDCGLSFLGDVSAAGLAGGIVNAMAIRGNMMIATYSDGSLESFDIAGGIPASHGDLQYSTAAVSSQGATYPNSIDITSDGHYAIFGDTSTSMVVEVSDIASGQLTRTLVHTSTAGISSSNVMLSPDETVVYVIDTQGDAVTALFFDKSTGGLSGGCTSPAIKGLSAKWSYLAGLALVSETGNGGGVYVAEFGSTSSIALVRLSVSGRKCALEEVTQSPFVDPNTAGLLSIAAFPPRAF